MFFVDAVAIGTVSSSTILRRSCDPGAPIWSKAAVTFLPRLFVVALAATAQSACAARRP
jgi:hypothetical protein